MAAGRVTVDVKYKVCVWGGLRIRRENYGLVSGRMKSNTKSNVICDGADREEDKLG